MTGFEILRSKIGKPLQEAKLQSFYLRGVLIDNVNLTFLKFDEWISVVSCDEITSVKKIENEFVAAAYHGDDEFKYPIEPIESKFPQFKKYIGKNLIDFKEIVLEKGETVSCGIDFYFEDDSNLILFDDIDKNKFYFEKTALKGMKEI